jgi:hypothetical protein
VPQAGTARFAPATTSCVGTGDTETPRASGARPDTRDTRRRSRTGPRTRRDPADNPPRGRTRSPMMSRGREHAEREHRRRTRRADIPGVRPARDSRPGDEREFGAVHVEAPRRGAAQSRTRANARDMLRPEAGHWASLPRIDHANGPANQGRCRHGVADDRGNPSGRGHGQVISQGTPFGSAEFIS